MLFTNKYKSVIVMLVRKFTYLITIICNLSMLQATLEPNTRPVSPEIALRSSELAIRNIELEAEIEEKRAVLKLQLEEKHKELQQIYDANPYKTFVEVEEIEGVMELKKSIHAIEREMHLLFIKARDIE